MEYIPHTEDDLQRALAVIGVNSIEELFADLPEAIRNPNVDIGPGMHEYQLAEHLRALAAKNRPVNTKFLNGGTAQHFIPTVTNHLAFQSEFVTSYTPYQPEVAQGILQATFEFQSIMTELTGLDVSNASMYDGASAAAEAALLAVRQTRRKKILVSQGVNPETREVIETYVKPLGIVVETISLVDLRTPEFAVASDVAGVVVEQPNWLGYLEDMATLAAATHEAGALFISVVDPLSLALLKAPGEYGTDVAVGDGQPLGNAVNFGGPSFGFMTINERYIRQFPGRLVGETTDVDGKRAYVLTLQAREQHIRRSKAKSNICSNHQLTAIQAAINVAALGPQGLRDIATGSVVQAHALADQLTAAGFAPLTSQKFFNEFVLPVNQEPEATRLALTEHGYAAGVPVPAEYGLGNALLLSATELASDDDIRAFVAALTELKNEGKA